jgi:large repetitive protein
MKSTKSIYPILLGLGICAMAAIAQTPGTFTPTGSMLTPRFGHTATLLPNGKVLIAGGYTVCSFFSSGPCPGTNSAELYDPVTGTFAATGSMTMTSPTGGILLPDGRVLFARGDGTAPSVEVYDPSTGNFNVAGNPATLTGVYTATLFNDGRVLLTGRVGTFPPPGPPPGLGAEVYDPAAGTFSPIANWPQQIGTPVTVLADGRVLFYRVVPGDIASGTTVLYDPATGTFSPTGGPDSFDKIPPATVLLNGKILFAGGDTDVSGVVSSAALYDPATGTLAATGSMATARLYHTATLLADGTVLVAGGGDQWGPAPPPLASAEIYDPTTGRFSATADMTTPRSSHSAVLLKGGQVLITGGSTAGSQSSISAVSSAELYCPANANCPADPWQTAITVMKTAAGTDSLNFYQWAWYWQGNASTFSATPAGFGVAGSISPDLFGQITAAGGGDPLANVSAEQWAAYFRQVVP